MKECTQCGLKYPDDETRCFVDNTVLVETTDPMVGTTLAGRYLVERPIGQGGMSTVYRARHTLVDRPVAVKVMSGSLAQDASLRERFRREAKNAAALAHPNIIEIYDYGETDEGSPFLVMELLNGAPLAQLIEAGPIDPSTVVVLGLQIAQGLARAHDFEVVHRDLKPENIFVCDAGAGRVIVKLLDFGIARSMHDSRLTNQGEIFGTPQYMAPERITSIDTGPPADLYALGVILFELLTGRLPFQSEELTGYFLQHLQKEPPRPSDLVPQCPRRLEELILQLLQKKPEERHVDAHAVIKELRALMPQGGAPVAAPHAPTPSGPIKAPTLPPTTVERWARRALIFDEMLQAAYPAGAPAQFAQLLDKVRAALRQMTDVRSAGLREQRELEVSEGQARDNRARLGHAVQSLAEDLSLARESVRQAQQEVSPYFQAEQQAQAAYESAHAHVVQAGGFGPFRRPDQNVARALRDIAEAIERWDLALAGADKARRWIGSREKEASDLEFQVQALRGQLERTESDYADRRAAAERILVAAGQEAGVQEKRLMDLARDFCDGLRDNKSLRPHFQRLEQESS